MMSVLKEFKGRVGRTITPTKTGGYDLDLSLTWGRGPDGAGLDSEIF